MASARFAKAGYVTGGFSASRRNVTSGRVASLAGGADLPTLDVGRLRATWLFTQAEAFSLAALFAAGGFSHSQYLGDIVAMLCPPVEDELVRLLGGRYAGD